MPYAPPFGGDSYRPDRDRDRDIHPHSPSGPYFDREDRDLYRPSRGDSDRYRTGRPGRSWSSSNTMRSRDRDREGSIKSPKSVTSVGSTSHWSSRARDDTSRLDSHRDEERNSRTMEPSDRESRHSSKERPMHDRPPALQRPPSRLSSPEQPLSAKTEGSDHTIRAMERIQRDTKSLPSSPIHATPPKHELLVRSDDKKSLQQPSDSIVPESLPAESTSIDKPTPSSDTNAAIPQQSIPDETTSSKPVTEKELTQQEIVERIGQIENDISMYEELLEQVTKREEEAAAAATTTTTAAAVVEDPIRAEENGTTTTTTLAETEDQKEAGWNVKLPSNKHFKPLVKITCMFLILKSYH